MNRLFLLPLCVATSAHAVVIYDLAGPADYGATVIPADYSLANATVGDTRQGVLLDDCYAVAVVAGILQRNPTYLQRNYQVLPNGNVDVRFVSGGVWSDIIVTSAVNWFWGDATTGFDDSNSNGAVAILFKAYAYFRNPAVNMMSDLDWGFPSETMNALGLSARTITANTASISKAFAAGDDVVVDTGFLAPPHGVATHSYTVTAINADGTIELRSGWGDGYQYRGIDEYLKADDQWLSTYSAGVFDGSYGGAAPFAVPEPGTLQAFALGLASLMTRHGLRRKRGRKG